jgi:hypothetical protein
VKNCVSPTPLTDQPIACGATWIICISPSFG